MTQQRGGFALGFIIGLLVGLTLALGVALYVAKVPVPFVNKVPQRTAEQDAAEAERNKNWDPNAALVPKGQRAASGGLSSTPAHTPVTPAATPDAAEAVKTVPTVKEAAPATASAPAKDPAAILNGTAASAPAPFVQVPGFYLQAGAFSRMEDAEAQRAKLAMQGFTARITEREQSGRTVYRVRLGVFATKEEADGTQERLRAASIDSALVRVDK